MIAPTLSMIPTRNEYLKTRFFYLSLKLIDYQDQVDKTVVYQRKGQVIELKLILNLIHQSAISII